MSKTPLDRVIVFSVLVAVGLAGRLEAASSPVMKDAPNVRVQEDNRPDPLTTHQLQLREQALPAKLQGKAPGRVKEVARGQYVELQREGERAVWTVLGEFADLSHNAIPAPDRSVDNSTLWASDFNRDYYLDLLFGEAPGANSMRAYYIEQSSGRFAFHGDVTDWVPVPGGAKTYDDDLGTWQFLEDCVNGWYATQIAAGKTLDQINTYLSHFDLWDRYDYDGDGNFEEPDGYIDTLQFIHAGEGEEAGGGILGEDAIWSHSWYTHYERIGVAGPDFNKLGGSRIGESAYWIGKYTIQPENGGVGVFAHEAGHDLGLPDLYDTDGGDNGVGFWSLMASGSWLSDGTVDIGSKPSHLGAWEKFALGWLNYEVAQAGKKSQHKLGPLEATTKQAQGLFVILPKKRVIEDVGDPYAGSYYYYSSAGDTLDNFMFKAFNLPAGATLNAKVKYAIEYDYDYAYVVYSTDNGATWQSLETNRSSTTDPYGENQGYGITGTSGGWVDLQANLPSGNALLGFRYRTDANTGGFGLMVDDINITGLPTDGAESDAGWTYKPAVGFHVTTGVESKLWNHYYIAEYRQYRGYDATLKSGPYYFGYQNNPALGNFVDHFPYQDGLLINYWDTSQANNQTSVHPGEGLLLPIDAHFAALRNVNDAVWGNRIQTYDSPFGLERTDALNNLHVNSVASPIPSLPAVSVFDDRTLYWDPANPQGSVKNPNTGTQIRVLSVSSLGGFMQVEVRPAKP